MSNQGPINMEHVEGAAPSDIKGREVNPDQDETTPDNKDVKDDKKDVDEHMQNILEHVPEVLRERVSKIERAELSMPGAPRDREAYEAYLGAEKMIRDIKRREAKKKFSWKGVPGQSG